MSYSSVIAGDSPTNWWRFRPEASSIARNHLPSKPSLANITTAGSFSTPQSYTGIAADGGSYLIHPDDKFDGGVPCFVVPCIGVPYSAEIWTYTTLAVWNTTGNAAMWGAGANSTMAAVSFNGTGFPVWGTTGSGACSGHPATSAVLQVGAWVHQVITMAGTTAHYFINGVLNDSCTFTASNPAAFDGGHVGSGTGTGIAFFACEFATYGVALSSTQVAAHYAAADTLAPPRWTQGLGSACQ